MAIRKPKKKAKKNPYRLSSDRQPGIKKANEKKPKSDNKIALELNKRGFNLARRTITKYRKKLNIASSRNR